MNQGSYRESERGNVLFLVLMAVGLFGALTFAISNMMQGTPDKITDENAKLYANEILDYARSMKLAIQRMRIDNECEDTEINFENSTVAGYTNAGAPSDNSCDVFDFTDGGGMAYVLPSADWLQSSYSGSDLYGEWFFTGNTCIEDVGGDETNCHTDTLDNNDLIIYLPYVKPSICSYLNNIFAILTDADDVWDTSDPKFTGSYTEQERNDGGGLVHQVGCVQSTAGSPGGGAYIFFSVLIPR